MDEELSGSQEPWQRGIDLITSAGESDPLYDPHEKDSLLKACRILGHELNIRFLTPPVREIEAPPQTHLEDICSASHIRFRHVKLDKRWWKEDGGHFLGFLQKRPVACIWRNGKYCLVDPSLEKERVIDQTVAEHIDPIGFEFFPHLPSEARDFFSFLLGKEKWLILLLVGLGFLITLLNFTLPYGIKFIFNDLLSHNNLPLFWQLGLGLLVAILISALLQIVAAFIFFRLITHAMTKLQKGFWDRFFRMPTSFFKKIGKGELWGKVVRLSQLGNFYSVQNCMIAFFSLFSVLFLIPMLHFSPFLTGVAIIATLAVITLSAGLLFWLNTYASRQSSLQKKTQKFLYQLFTGFKKIKEMRCENQIFSIWAGYFSTLKKKDRSAGSASSLLMAILATLPIFLLFVLFTSLIISHDEAKNLTLGAFFGFLISYLFFSLPLYHFIPLLAGYGSLNSLWGEWRSLFKVPIENEIGKLRPDKFSGAIELEHVSFRNPDQEIDVLKDISMHIREGSCVGLVGPSGSGKTTLLRLLLELEKPKTGEIFFDGIPIEKFDMHYLRQKIAGIFHESTILEGTLMDNLACGRFHTSEDIAQALDLSGLTETLKHFPMGLHTLLINGGSTLSSTEQARILLGRSLLSQPKILLIDDVLTSLTDFESMKLIDQINRLAATKVFVTQRLEALKKMDYIYFLKEGSFVEFGSFDDLIARNGHFVEFFNSPYAQTRISTSFE